MFADHLHLWPAMAYLCSGRYGVGRGGGVSDGHKSEATEPSMHIGGSERVAYTTLGSELSEFWNGEGYLSTSRACCHLIRHSSIIIKTFAVEAEFVENSLRNKLAIIMQF
jgi:hypothetical protein